MVSSSLSSSGSSIGSDHRHLRSGHSSTHSQQQSTITESAKTVTEDAPQGYAEWRSRILANLSNRRNNNVCSNNNYLDRCSSLRAEDLTGTENQLAEVRSITEIYRSAEVTAGEGDTISQSTLEGYFLFVDWKFC
ncbi:unnamed protein product [Gongylonema pulchrum]|uniref:Uncharacterized protein n=1 Tax=Gongylonema pulchrum TaxID=637853 RepID=A0A3P6QUI1_9BILA|nr:unnamed protein product [Gongylonema pulchrum]